MNPLSVCTFLFFTAVCSAEEMRHLGLFSNKAEGFKIVNIMVHSDGMAALIGPTSGVIGEWTLSEPSSKLTVTFVEPSTMEELSLELLFDEESRTYGIVKKHEEGKSVPPYDLRYVSSEIPEAMVETFKAYPEKIQSMKARLEVEKEYQRLLEEQLKREEPEYEKTVREIEAEPKMVLGEDFHSKELTKFGHYPPKVRAFRDTLSDPSVAYPESVLIELLNTIPNDHHSLQKLVFERPELTGETLLDFYPRALEWGELDFGILANIAKHPNTPIKIVRELAESRNIPVGATRPAKNRLRELERKNRIKD